MPAPTRSQPPLFRAIERALLRRRLAQLDPRMRGEIALLAFLIAGFLFWQVRVPLDGLVRARGPGAGAAVVAVVWLGLAGLAAALAGTRHARQLRTGPAGPEWLALPLEPAALERHLAWSARGITLWLAVPAVAVLIAAAGLLPAGWLALLGAAFPPLLVAGGRAGAALGYRLALRGAEPRPGLAPIERLLAAAAPRGGRRPLAPARWRRVPAWLALAGKDLRLTRRRPAIRSAALWPAAWGLASLLAWNLPLEPVVLHLLAFGLALLAAAALAEWLIVLIGSDPFPTLRVLPLGVRTVWGARIGWGLAGALVLAAAQAVGADPLVPPARRLLAAWTGGAALAIAALGANYGVTLFPRADVAGRVLGLALALALAASIMIPLAGWVVLFTALIHSSRRLPRWSRLEEV